MYIIYPFSFARPNNICSISDFKKNWLLVNSIFMVRNKPEEVYVHNWYTARSMPINYLINFWKIYNLSINYLTNFWTTTLSIWGSVAKCDWAPGLLGCCLSAWLPRPGLAAGCVLRSVAPAWVPGAGRSRPVHCTTTLLGCSFRMLHCT